jgi:predicted phosphodiesterase
VERWEGGTRLKFGVVSDTQLCSQKQQLTFLNQVYDKFQREGIDTVLHAGDLVDGDGRVYPGQEYDLFAHGFDRQLDYATEMYPRREGIKTHVISGNHDWSFHQRKGADILRSLAERRDDIVYHGYGGAKIILSGLNIYLIHLKSGLTYARSYKIQKIIEQFAPKEKPDLMFAGDKHSWAHLPMYRNVFAWQMGCFQAQTDHEKRLGLYPEIGALVVEAHFNTKGADNRDQEKPGHAGRVSVVEYGFRVLPQYVPVENDW